MFKVVLLAKEKETLFYEAKFSENFNPSARYAVGINCRTHSIYLNEHGKPRTELFVGDKLHLNRAGYIRWAAAIKSQLDRVLNGAQKGDFQ
ncbi:MAG: hypothetical protein AB8F34_15580 [Akkermansiaceae bacterium]